LEADLAVKKADLEKKEEEDAAKKKAEEDMDAVAAKMQDEFNKSGSTEANEEDGDGKEKQAVAEVEPTKEE